MTGFAEARAESGEHAVTVTIRAVNHRSLDIKVRVTNGAARLEAGIRRKIRQQVRRGSVQVNLEVSTDGRLTGSVDREAVEARLDAFRQVADLCGTDVPPDPNVLLSLPRIFQAERAEIPADTLAELVATCIDRAMPAFDRSRADEAAAMVADISEHADAIEAEVETVSGSVEEILALWRRGFESRLGELLGELDVDPDRLAREVAHQAARSDVTEELLRLRAHIDGVRRCLVDSPEIGKRIDFLAQEMNREANTLLSKTQSLGSQALPVTNAGLRIRSAIEKIREQAQNLQ